MLVVRLLLFLYFLIFKKLPSRKKLRESKKTE
jgi:hypothetical protein